MTDITLDRYLIWGTSTARASFTPSPGVGGTGTNILPIWVDSNVAGFPAWFWDTATSSWQPWAAGTSSSSRQLWQYKAKTGATSGYPGDGFMLWDNATQTSATHLLFSHITDDGLDIDLFLAQLPASGTLIIQDAGSSTNFQQWTITGAAVNTNAGTSTSYWTVPVTLASSGGTGATGFTNNTRLIAVVFASGTGTVTTSGSPASGNLAKFSGATSITNTDLSGDVTTSGGVATTIANNAVTTAKIADANVTLAKIQNAAASSKLLGSGATGSGSAYTELTLGTNLSMSGTTLNATGGSGTVTSVALALPSYFTVSGSPVTTSGTLTAVLAAPLVQPQGRLTLTSNTPVMTADVTAATSIYYAPYVGGRVPVWDGSEWVLLDISSQLTMSLDTTNQPVSVIQDLFVYNSSGSAAIGAGPSWVNTATVTITIATPGVVTWTGHGLAEGAPVIFTTSGALPTGITAGTIYYVGKSPATNSFNISTSVANAAAGTLVATSGSQSGTQTGTNHTSVRGAGAGTTELQLLNGVWTNKNSITLTNGAGAGTSAAANKATYVGSFYTTAAGQTGMAFQPTAAGGGTNNILGLWNAYNRIQIKAMSRDSTGSWSYGTATWRPTNNNVANRVSCIDGLAQSFVTTRATVLGQPSGINYGGIGVTQDHTDTPPVLTSNFGATANLQWPDSAHVDYFPALGLHYYQGMEVQAGSGNVTFYGAGYQSVQINMDM